VKGAAGRPKLKRSKVPQGKPPKTAARAARQAEGLPSKFAAYLASIDDKLAELETGATIRR
jgi:hypothetical protein